MIKKRQKLILAFAVIILGLVLINSMFKAEPQRKIDPNFSEIPFENAKFAVKNSDNVFVAKIIRQTGTENITPDLPGTQFEVEVIYNIKGNLEGTVIVNQQGGYRDGVLYVKYHDKIFISEEPPSSFLLRSGNVYLVSSEFDKDKNQYKLIPYPQAYVKIEGDSHVEELVKNEIVQTYQAAYISMKCKIGVFGFCLIKYYE